MFSRREHVPVSVSCRSRSERIHAPPRLPQGLRAVVLRSRHVSWILGTTTPPRPRPPAIAVDRYVARLRLPKRAVRWTAWVLFPAGRQVRVTPLEGFQAPFHSQRQLLWPSRRQAMGVGVGMGEDLLPESRTWSKEEIMGAKSSRDWLSNWSLGLIGK